MRLHVSVGAVGLVLALLGPGRLSAQNTLSFHAGASVATLGGRDAVDVGVDPKIGLNLGASLTFGLGRNLGLRVGGAYVQKGLSVSGQGGEATLFLDYIEIPVLLRLRVPTAVRLSPRFFVGPAISINTRCSTKIVLQGSGETLDCDVDSVKSIDLGGMAGVGVDIATPGSLLITFDVFYNVGLTSWDASASADDVKNRAWSILVGVAAPAG